MRQIVFMLPCCVLLCLLGCVVFQPQAAGPLDALLDFGNAPVKTVKSQHGDVVCMSSEPMAIRGGGLFCGMGSVPRISLPPAFGKEGKLTVSLWLKRTAMIGEQGNYGLLFKGSRQGFPRIQFQVSIRRNRPEFKYTSATGQWRGIMQNGSDWVGIGKRVRLDSLPMIQADRWVMLSAVFDRGRLGIYLDGKLFMETVNNPPMAQNDLPVLVGISQSGAGFPCWTFPGLLARIRFSEHAYTQADLADLEARERSLLDEALSPDVQLPKTDFSTTLPSVKSYERQLPASLPGKPNAVAELRMLGGVPRLYVNGNLISAQAMMPSPYVPPQKAGQSIRDFAAAGTRLYSNIIWTQYSRGTWWKGEKNYDFAQLDRMMEAMIAAAPEGYVFPRIKLDPPEWWSRQHPQHMVAKDQVAPSSKLWQTLAKGMLRDVVTHMEQAPYAGRIIGYQFGALIGSEWIAHRFKCPVADEAYREFLRRRYHNDLAALRRHYAKPDITFETMTLDARTPSHDPLDPVPSPEVLAGTRNLNDFRGKTVAGLILDVAGIIKDITGGKKLTGVFFGYGSPEHSQLQTLLTSPLIDYICSPTNYSSRRAGQPGRFSSNFQAACRLHGKLYFDEADIRTHYYRQLVDYRCRSEAETVNSIKRALGYCLTQGHDAWWFLLVGNETFHDQTLMTVIARGNQLVRESLQGSASPKPQVAVFVNGKQVHGNPMFKIGLLETMQLSVLPQAGAPYDTYELGDVTNPNLPDYQLYLFLDAFDLRDEEAKAIREKVRRKGKTAVWIYAPGYYRNGTPRENGVGEVTGIALQEELAPQAPPESARFRQQNMAFCRLSRRFAVTDPQAEILGTYGGKPAMAWKDLPGGYHSVYLLTQPNTSLLRHIYRRAGVHVYMDSDDTVSAGREFIMVHAASAGKKTVRLPGSYRIREVFRDKVEGERVTCIQDDFAFGETKIYRLEP